MEETMFMIKFNNKYAKFYDDNRFQVELGEDGLYRVYSRIRKNVVIECPRESVMYIQYGIKKKPQDNNVDEPVEEEVEAND